MLITPATETKLRVRVNEADFIKQFNECVKNDVYFKLHFTDAGLHEVYSILTRTSPSLEWHNLGDICNHIQEKLIHEYLEEYELEYSEIEQQSHFIALTEETVLYFAGFGG